MEEPKINQGFDRGIDYKVIRKKFKIEMERLINYFEDIKDEQKFDRKKNKLLLKIIYLTISCIQLRNGSRVSESIDAFKIFITKQNFYEKVLVKIAKSDSIKTNKLGKKIKLKIRYRKMMFPNWFDFDIMEVIKDSEAFQEIINCNRLRKRILSYLITNFNSNTHSLRYACINYLLYTKKIDIGIVCKFVGHSNPNQIIKYTQLKQIDGIFDLDI